MRTTVDLPDDLYRALKARAALGGLKVRDLVAQYLAAGLQQADHQDIPGHPADLPVLIPGSGRRMASLSSAEMEEALDDESGQG